MKSKGFTLVELLAMLVVLGIIIGISIPNINNILRKQRVNQLITDATNMVETAKIKTAKNNDEKPTGNECIVYSLDYLNDNDNIIKGPNGGEYNQYESLVILKKVNNKYEYYVRLIEEKDTKKLGVIDKSLTQIKDYYKDKVSIDTISSSLLGISKNQDPTTSLSKIETLGLCGNIKKYYRTYCIHAINNKYYDIKGNEITQQEYKNWCELKEE